MSEQGQKFDTNKPRMSLLPKGALNAVIRVLEFGATKYQVDNWKHVPDAKTRYYDAMQRHIDAWWHGEQKDSETGEHHLAHAICCGMFLWWFDDMDSKVMVGQGFAAKFVRKGDLEKIENCLHISTSMFHDDKAECFGCGAIVNHERKVIGVKRGAND
ncbi:dATP/dGTP diphosphohydrolase domain-containing protein [Acinetobacter sp. CS-2]|uniref:dATP/dGTP diphosphohydrolase domain-containing protein n=1 Tax=Acinetobacter sp. CS-2 TaxID=2798861 RepID=UPI001905053F|nr:dATP/dGTP diphosphohydrolase domain-containing protein [Acinetobacter sp. CS-2]QQN40312.1 hypothetical protein JFY49_05150 [Acinetobacter sp. CS-2]